MEIERYYTKDEILERYLNIIYLGAGAYGVDAAAHTYFGKGVEKLSVGQAAMLAGVVAAPSDYSPFANMDLARDRQRHVLDRMVESGYITPEPSRRSVRRAARARVAARTRLAGLRFSVLHDVRDRAVGETVRRGRRARRRPAGLHDARSAHGTDRARGRDVGRRSGARRGHQRARSGARFDPALDRRDRRDDRRPALFAGQSVQSRVAGEAPARLVVQGLRLHRCHRFGHAAVDDHRRFAGRVSDGRRHELVAERRRFPVYGRGHAAHGADALAQRRRGQAGRAYRPGSRDRLRAPHGRHVRARAESFARARFVGGIGAGSGQRVLDARQPRAARRSDAVPLGERFARQHRAGQSVRAGQRRRRRRAPRS